MPQAGSKINCLSPGSSIATVILHTFRGVKNSPRSPRKLDPTISS